MQSNVEELLALLTSSNNKQAYGALKALIALSTESDALYPYMDRFIDMMDSTNSYARTRGLTLIAHNAQWDSDNKIDEILSSYLEHVTDEKPICARNCIKLLPIIAKAKPSLAPAIASALRNANLSRYADSMQPLIQKDIVDSLLAMRL